MSEYVKKASLGGYKAVPGGYSDPDLTHVILTKNEYDKLVDRVNTAERELSNQKISTKLQIESVQRNAAAQIKTEKAAADKITAAAKEKAAQWMKEAEYQRGLNSNLLRISRERANADRKLKPKREHTGYVVISSTERDHSYKDSYGKVKTVHIWETVLQSPYRIDFTEEQARRETEDLFAGDEWMIQKIGINGIFLEGYADMLREPAADGWMDCNVVIGLKLRANYRSEYWEAILLHTKPLDVVPADMRP